MEQSPTLDRYLASLLVMKGSDLHLKPGSLARVRVNGDLRTLDNVPAPTDNEMATMARTTMSERSWDMFSKAGECDYAYVQADGTRYRVNAYLHQQKVALSLRHILPHPPTAADLHLPAIVTDLCDNRRGLIIVTGPTGSGKSSTLAAMVDVINSTRSAHIITLEDPVEYIHSDKSSLINQREIGFDTKSFSHAIRASMREDPDVILVGEMRDLATVEAAIQAAETGHLVLSTLHTIGAAETISRILDVFPPHQHAQVRISLADVLRGIVSQRLVLNVNGSAREPACEILVSNGRVRQAIVDPLHNPDLLSIIEESTFYGMQTFDQALFQLVDTGAISVETALENASNAHDLSLKLKERADPDSAGVDVY